MVLSSGLFWNVSLKTHCLLHFLSYKLFMYFKDRVIETQRESFHHLIHSKELDQQCSSWDINQIPHRILALQAAALPIRPQCWSLHYYIFILTWHPTCTADSCTQQCPGPFFISFYCQHSIHCPITVPSTRPPSSLQPVSLKGWPPTSPTSLSSSSLLPPTTAFNVSLRRQ